MYKNGPCNLHADELSRIPALVETSADNWDEIRSHFIDNHLLEDTDMNNAKSTALRHRLRYKHAHRQYQLQRDYRTTKDPKGLDDMVNDKLFFRLPAPASAKPMCESTSDEKMATAQFKDPFCVYISRRLNERVVLLLEKMKTKFYAVKPPTTKSLSLSLSDKASFTSATRQGWPDIPFQEKYTNLAVREFISILRVDCYSTVQQCPTCTKHRIQLALTFNNCSFFLQQLHWSQ